MFKDVTLGQYFPGHSVIHRLDPRVKLLLMTAYFILVFMVKGFIGYAWLAVYVALGTALSGLSFRYLLKGLKPLSYLLVFTLILNTFLTPGKTVWWSWWIFTLTKEGLLNAIYFSLRLIFLVVGTSLLTLTTSPMALTDALERLLGPLKVLHLPIHEVAMMMTIALRFIPTLLLETEKIMKAQMARGADLESGNIFKRAKAMVPILVPLFVSAFRRADELALAMEARCYRGGDGRTRMKVLHMGKIDFIAIMVTAVIAALVLLPRWVPLPGWWV